MQRTWKWKFVEKSDDKERRYIRHCSHRESSFVRKSQSVESPGRISHNQTGIANLSDQAYDWVRSNHDHLSYTMETSKQREMSELFEVNHNTGACSPMRLLDKAWLDIERTHWFQFMNRFHRIRSTWNVTYRPCFANYRDFLLHWKVINRCLLNWDFCLCYY